MRLVVVHMSRLASRITAKRLKAAKSSMSTRPVCFHDHGLLPPALITSARRIPRADPELATGRPANMHLALWDFSGDSAVFEYINGKLVIHHGKQYKGPPNSPTYDQQFAIMEYWRGAGVCRNLFRALPALRTASFRKFPLEAIRPRRPLKYISGSPQQKFQNQAAMSCYR